MLKLCVPQVRGRGGKVVVNAYRLEGSLQACPKCLALCYQELLKEIELVKTYS